jgi:peroxiredoxin Q/BCP
MVSLDDPEKNKEFAESLGAKHVLLSDPTGEVAKAYGVSGFGGLFAKRRTFYIDASGVVQAIDRNVKTATAGQDIARKLEELHCPTHSDD